MRRVVLIGSGNVAETLAQAVAASSYDLVQLWARNRERGEALARKAGCPWAGTPEALAPADIYLIAVSDRAIGEVAATLDFGGAVVAHTAGSIPYDVLPERIARRGIFYPLQTFTAGRPVDFRRIPLFVAGNDAGAVQALTDLAKALSEQVRVTSPETLPRLHLAAVFACNFTNHLYALAEALAVEAGVSPGVLHPLIAETAAKALASPRAADVQTGPARRGDRLTQERHLALLANRPCLQALYELISKDIWETSKKI